MAQYWRLALWSFAAAILCCSSVSEAHCAYARLNETYMNSLCSTQPTMSAAPCTIYNMCNNATISPPLFDTVCNSSVLATRLCLDDTASGVPECEHWMEHTLESVNVTALPACYESLGTNSSIPNTTVVRQAAFDNCDAMGGAGSMAGCDICTANTVEGCPEPFYALALGCIEMEMSGCTSGGWKGYCSNEAAVDGMYGIGAGVLCLPEAQRVPAPPPAMPSNSTPPIINDTRFVAAGTQLGLGYALLAPLVLSVVMAVLL